MTATDVGVQVIVNSGGFDMTGFTAVLRVKGPSDTAFRALPLTVTPHNDGSPQTQATLRGTSGTQASDFPVPGRYEVQLEVTTGSAQLFRSPMGTVPVYALVA